MRPPTHSTSTRIITTALLSLLLSASVTPAQTRAPTTPRAPQPGLTAIEQACHQYGALLGLAAQVRDRGESYLATLRTTRQLPAYQGASAQVQRV
jgi:hypothetical protein